MKKFYFLLLALYCIVPANAQIINFPDANFKAKLLQADATNSIAWNLSSVNFKIDANSNGEIEIDEASQVKLLSVSQANIVSLSGIENFTNMISLWCDNNQITSLNLSTLLSLKNLYCGNNDIILLSASDLPQNLEHLQCSENPILSLDLNSLPNLYGVIAESCPIEELFVKNGVVGIVSVMDSPNIRYACIDEGEEFIVPALAVLNSYCSFVPGGTFYTIQGQQKFDNESNGCDIGDSFIPNFKYSISDGTTTGSIISNNSGNYSISVQAGTHTMTPVLENPTYFSVLPSNVVVNFPTQTSPFTQDFCVIANGIHPDLEVTLLPTMRARPGFDATYKLVYKNKGNQTQSGSVNLTFNDAILDFVLATPAVNNQTTNNLSWNFVNLQPFETREITFTLNVNSPMETPAVNDGDVLNYTASISSAATDETPEDNTFTLNQTVVNSFDPNDKTCLEGVTIAPSEVGKYVHYLIRFENNGTANAQNIVVKDMIDTNKFDINSLVPIKGSHSFVTKITAGNKVEFIFENINLPFDDANNDGYVAFKIKTKPTLVTGNTFSNSASIYFDYNFPIVTNTAVTTIQALSTQDFAFGTYFTVYPNPVNNVLNIETKQTIEVSSVSIYNQLGQLVLVMPNAQNAKSVDVSSLSAGNYFIKINSDKGTSNAKFVKK